MYCTFKVFRYFHFLFYTASFPITVYYMAIHLYVGIIATFLFMLNVQWNMNCKKQHAHCTVPFKLCVFYCAILVVCGRRNDDLEQNEGSQRDKKRRVLHDPWWYANCKWGKWNKSNSVLIEGMLHRCLIDVLFIYQVTLSYGSSKSQSPPCLTNTMCFSSTRPRTALQVMMR